MSASFRGPLRRPLLSLVLAAAVVVAAAPQTAASAAPVPITAAIGPTIPVEPDGMVGTALAPADPKLVQRKIAAQSIATAARLPVTGYDVSSTALYRPPVGGRMYDSTTVTPIEGFGLVDSEGVRMFKPAGSSKLYNHPVAQGAYALHNLNSYRLTGKRAYLDIALKNAQRLVDRHVNSGGAWYYPYDFDYAPLGNAREMLRAPWYSGMAQGRVLSVFVRAFEATGDLKWKVAAAATFASLTQEPSGDAPYGTYVDSQRRLWLETYPRYPASMGENVLNGHAVGVFGLIDYWSLTHNPLAAQLAKGSIATIETTAMNGFRRVKASSLYSLRHKTAANTYHQIHVRQFLQLWRYTNRIYFVNAANAYRNDYPEPLTAGTMRATRRTSTIYQVDSSMRIIRSKRVYFTRNTHAPTDRRQRISGGPVALRASKGPYRNWWFPEAHGATWLLGAKDTHRYSPNAQVWFAPGTYTAYRLNSAGEVVGRKTVTFSRPSSAPSTHSGVVQARSAYYMARGTYAGYWMPMFRGVSVTSP